MTDCTIRLNFNGRVLACQWGDHDPEPYEHVNYDYEHSPISGIRWSTADPWSFDATCKPCGGDEANYGGGAMTAHDHTVRTPGCFRCGLSADEVADTAPVVTKAMMIAFLTADADLDAPNDTERLRAAIAAALAAAPTVDGWVWCETCETTIHRDEQGIWHDATCGPHRTLILGPEVER